MDDLISREVAAKILRARANMSVGTPKQVFYAAAVMIDKLPAVDAEPVITGETSDGYHALAYIQQLENHIGELTEKVAQLEAAQPKWIYVHSCPPDAKF